MQKNLFEEHQPPRTPPSIIKPFEILVGENSNGPHYAVMGKGGEVLRVTCLPLDLPNVPWQYVGWAKEKERLSLDQLIVFAKALEQFIKSRTNGLHG